MPINGPFTYQIRFTPNEITEVVCPDGRRCNAFRGEASQQVPKLYMVSDGGEPLYVGKTNRRLRERLRDGLKAGGEHGYHGYAWRDRLTQATIDVWIAVGADAQNPNIETVEAEVVFWIRQEYDQWPEHQTEIHFHASCDDHRQAARQIVKHFLNN